MFHHSIAYQKNKFVFLSQGFKCNVSSCKEFTSYKSFTSSFLIFTLFIQQAIPNGIQTWNVEAPVKPVPPDHNIAITVIITTTRVSISTMVVTTGNPPATEPPHKRKKIYSTSVACVTRVQGGVKRWQTSVMIAAPSIQWKTPSSVVSVASGGWLWLDQNNCNMHYNTSLFYTVQFEIKKYLCLSLWGYQI